MERDNNSSQTENRRLIDENKLLREELAELQLENQELHEHVSLLAKQIRRFEEQADDEAQTDDDVEIDNGEPIDEGQWNGGTKSDGTQTDDGVEIEDSIGFPRNRLTLATRP
jgi:hypothetical protein